MSNDSQCFIIDLAYFIDEIKANNCNLSDKSILNNIKIIYKQAYYLNLTPMSDPELNDEERFAVQSLLQLENSNDQLNLSQDWNNPQNTKSKNKIKNANTHSNFIQINKKINPQKLQQNNFINRQRLLNLQSFRRTRSLFDPMKIFKMGTRQLVYDHPSNTHYVSDSKGKRIIHKHPDQIRDLNFKSGHPTKNISNKKDDLNLTRFNEIRHNSNEFINGQSVIIQVQSYQENFNRKQVEYLMSKTLGAKNFKQHMNFDKKDSPFGVSMLQIKSQDMKLRKQNQNELKQMNKKGKGVKITSKMRFTAYVNKKTTQGQHSVKNSEHSSSLDLKILKSNEQMAMSLRLLLNNLKSKAYTQGKKSDANDKQGMPLQYHNFGSKIFDKQRLFKHYESEQFRNQKKNRMINKKLPKEFVRDEMVNQKNMKEESQRTNHKPYEVNDMIRVSSPRRYYQKSVNKNSQSKETQIFNIKRIA